MSQQPEDRGESYAEMEQEGLSVRDEDTLTDHTDTNNQRSDGAEVFDDNWGYDLLWAHRARWREGASEDEDLEPFVLNARRIQMGDPAATATTPGQEQPVRRAYKVKDMPEGYSGYLDEAAVVAAADPQDPLLYVDRQAVLHPRARQRRNREPIGYKLTRLDTGGTEYRYELNEAWPDTSVVYPDTRSGDTLIKDGYLAILPEEMKVLGWDEGGFTADAPDQP